MNRRLVISGLCLALGAARLAANALGEQVAHVVSSPDVSGLLLGVGFAGLLIEMRTLRLVAGLVGAAALTFFFATHVAVSGDAAVWLLAVLGLLGIVIELHLLPGHGIGGVLGVAALVAAVAVAFGTLPLVAVAQALAIAIVVIVVATVVAARLFPVNAFARRMAFGDVQGPEYVAAPDQRALLGRHGFAATYLRPAGVASIEGRRVDVLSEGEFVPAGSAVVVTRVEGARVFVRQEGAPCP